MKFDCVVKLWNCCDQIIYKEENCKFIVEKNGRYFCFEVNNNNQDVTAKEVESNIEDMIYEDLNTYYEWCKYGGEVEIELSKCKIIDNNNFLLEMVKQENIEKYSKLSLVCSKFEKIKLDNWKLP